MLHGRLIGRAGAAAPEIRVASAGGELRDQSGAAYEIEISGRGALLRQPASGACYSARWLFDSARQPIVATQQRGPLAGFVFTLYPPAAAHTLWAHFRASMSFAAANDTLASAGFRRSPLDGWFNRRHRHQLAPGFSDIHFRSRGTLWTGANSGHAVLFISPQADDDVCGTVHFGEHSIYHPIGLLHHWVETAR